LLAILTSGPFVQNFKEIMRTSIGHTKVKEDTTLFFGFSTSIMFQPCTAGLLRPFHSLEGFSGPEAGMMGDAARF
jgi:hypothetical protein